MKQINIELTEDQADKLRKEIGDEVDRLPENKKWFAIFQVRLRPIALQSDCVVECAGCVAHGKTATKLFNFVNTHINMNKEW